MSYKVTVLKSKAGEKTSTISAFEGLADFVVRPALLAEVLRSEMINLREGNAHTKIRSEVRGGGRKPWKQKGTGRARHGSIRSPIWIGGGVTFGPRNERNWHSKINKKARLSALKSIFKDRLDDKSVFALADDFGFSKTKEAGDFFQVSFKTLPKNTVVLYDVADKTKLNGLANLNLKLININNMKLSQLAKGTTYIMTPSAIQKVEQRFQ